MNPSIPGVVFNKAILLAVVGMLVLAGSMALARQPEPPARKAWLGVSVRDVSARIAQENKLDDASGAFVADVVDDSPADSAGIKEHDVIVQFGKRQIDDADDLVNAVRKMNAGDKVAVAVVRNGDKKTVDVTLATAPRMRGPRIAADNLIRKIRIVTSREAEGMKLMELNDQLSEYFGVPGGTGVLVTRVGKGSAAEKAGIKAGDVLLKIGKRTIDDMEDVSKAFSRYDEGDKVGIEISRKGSNKTLSLEVREDRDHSSFDLFRHGEEGMLDHPPFEEYHFRVPEWDNDSFQFSVPDIHPDMKNLERNLRNMEQSLKNRQRDLLRSVREFRTSAV